MGLWLLLVSGPHYISADGTLMTGEPEENSLVWLNQQCSAKDVHLWIHGYSTICGKWMLQVWFTTLRWGGRRIEIRTEGVMREAAAVRDATLSQGIQAGRDKETVSSQMVRKELVLMVKTLWCYPLPALLQTSDLQHCPFMNLCGFMSLCLWSFVTVAIESNYIWERRISWIWT